MIGKYRHTLTNEVFFVSVDKRNNVALEYIESRTKAGIRSQTTKQHIDKLLSFGLIIKL